MRIAFISDAAYPWHQGGLEAVELTEAQGLAEKHDVHFFCMRWHTAQAPDMEHEFTRDGIHYHAMVPVTRSVFYRHSRRSIRTSVLFALSMFRIFNYRFDVVEANLFPFIHIPIVKLFCKLTGCKMVLDVVEIWSREYWTEYLGVIIGTLGYWFTNYFCLSADAYIANSSITERLLLEKGLGAHRVFRFAPVLDDKMIGRVRKLKQKRINRVIYWGRFIKEKRLDKWLRVVAEVHRKMKGATGILIGGGAEFDSVKRMVRELGLEKVVDVRSNIEDDEQLFKEVNKSGVLLHMSEREGMGVVALESLALGVPVVLPNYTPIPREVKDMCIVVDETELPGRLIDVLKSSNKGSYLKNTSALSDYYYSNVNNFYNSMFKSLGLAHAPRASLQA